MVSEIEELKKQIGELRDQISSQGKRIEILESYRREDLSIGPINLSIGEFISDYSSDLSLNDKTLFIGYFEQFHEHVSPLFKSIIEEGFKQARERPPKNLSDSINNNLDKKYFVLVKNEDNEKSGERTFKITATGIKHVEEMLRKRDSK